MHTISCTLPHIYVHRLTPKHKHKRRLNQHPTPLTQSKNPPSGSSRSRRRQGAKKDGEIAPHTPHPPLTTHPPTHPPNPHTTLHGLPAPPLTTTPKPHNQCMPTRVCQLSQRQQPEQPQGAKEEGEVDRVVVHALLLRRRPRRPERRQRPWSAVPCKCGYI